MKQWEKLFDSLTKDIVPVSHDEFERYEIVVKNLKVLFKKELLSQKAALRKKIEDLPTHELRSSDEVELLVHRDDILEVIDEA